MQRFSRGALEECVHQLVVGTHFSGCCRLHQLCWLLSAVCIECHLDGVVSSACSRCMLRRHLRREHLSIACSEAARASFTLIAVYSGVMNVPTLKLQYRLAGNFVSLCIVNFSLESRSGLRLVQCYDCKPLPQPIIKAP